MAIFATFWTGPIDALERACLMSFARQGHRVILFSFEDREPTDYYETRPASEIMSAEYLTRFITRGRPNIAHFADAFRVTMFTTRPYVWIDCDLILRAPLTADLDADIFVREGKDRVISSLLRIADPGIAARATAETMKLVDRDLPWAATQGIIPKAMVAEGYTGEIQDPAVYNPIDADDFYKLLLPEFRDECEQRCARAETIHLYNNILSKVGYYKDLLPPEGSYLHALLAPYAAQAGFVGVYPARVVRAMMEGWLLRFSGGEVGLGDTLRRIIPAMRATVKRRMWE